MNGIWIHTLVNPRTDCRRVLADEGTAGRRTEQWRLIRSGSGEGFGLLGFV